ncbi:MAG: beta-N-acetylhexosaminidase [Deltaproteobacteria bacterium]|nr:beta-N-acetylhexosaminidase [Deltaproteobacteria bacterium]
MTHGITSRIGQLFMAGMPGAGLDERTLFLIREFNLGGIIFFSRNIENPLQLAGLCRDLQKEALRSHGTPLFLAVDQEGGRVARLREPFTRFCGNEAIAADRECVKRAEEFGTATAKEMTLVGLNMDFAPVVDVQKGELEKHLQGRSFGDNPRKVALLGRTVIKFLQENGVMAVAKHFPGLGRAGVDPHVHLPIIDAPREEIERINLLPFRMAIDQGVTGIMSSHAVYPALDPKQPATLSREILARLLRDAMGFEGLIVTDDLEMGAIVGQRPVAEAAVAAFHAGADMLLICKEQQNVSDAYALIRDRLLQGKIAEERVLQSLERVEKAKARFLRAKEEISTAAVRDYFKMNA